MTSVEYEFEGETRHVVPVASSFAESLPTVIEELTRGAVISSRPTALHGCRSLRTRRTRATAPRRSWDPTLQAQVLRILGVEIEGGERPDVPSFWG